MRLDKIPSNTKNVNENISPEFSKALLNTQIEIDELKSNPNKWLKQAKESFNKICNGTAKLGTYSDLIAKLKSMGI